MSIRRPFGSICLLPLAAALGCGGSGGGSAAGGTNGMIGHDAGAGGGAVGGSGGNDGSEGGTSAAGGGVGASGTNGAGGTSATGGGGASGASGSSGAGGSGSSGAGGSGVGGGGGIAGGTGGGSGVGGGSGTGGADPRCQVAWAGDIQLGTAEDDQILGLIADADDNLIASGYEQGVVGVTNIEPDGNSRAVVMKLGPSGTMVWKTVLDTAATDTAEDVAIDPASGNLMVLGRTSGAFPTFVNQGQFDLFLALLDPNGQNATVFQTGNERPQHPARLSVGPGGAVVVAGWDDTYVLTNYVAANEDGFIATFSVDPAPAHTVTQTSLQYTFPPSATIPFSFATGAAAEQDGSGASYVITNVPGNSRGSQGMFVTKLRADHTTVWNDNISTLPVDAVTAVALSPSGDLFVTGGTFLTLGASAFGQEDAFVLKLDKATGAPIWAAQAGGADSEYPTALAVDATGNVYIAGYTLGSVVGGVANQGGADVFAMKFSATGNLLSVWQTGTPVDDMPTSLAVDRCGNAFVGGFTGGALVPGHPSAGGEDMFILKARF